MGLFLQLHSIFATLTVFDKLQKLQTTTGAIKHMKRTLLTTVGVLARLVVFWMTGVPVTNPAH